MVIKGTLINSSSSDSLNTTSSHFTGSTLLGKINRSTVSSSSLHNTFYLLRNYKPCFALLGIPQIGVILSNCPKGAILLGPLGNHRCLYARVRGSIVENSQT